jgi:nucleotide-binding universal stress UspA family protein
MDKKVVVLVHPGLPYRKTIKYGCERAREMNAKIHLLTIIPEINEAEQVSLAMHEFAPYPVIAHNMEKEANDFLDRAVQFCLDSNMTVETRVERGSIEEVIKRTARDRNIKLIVMPTPTKKQNHSSFLQAISQFAHEMLDYDLKCPVVTVLAT